MLQVGSFQDLLLPERLKSLLSQPAVQHFDYAVEKGKHVFIEKPVAVDGPGVRAMMATSEKARAKKLSIKRQIEGGGKGITTEDLVASVRQEFREHEDLPNTTNPDDWAKISGKKGERIVFVRTLLNKGDEATGGRQIERVTTGQYL